MCCQLIHWLHCSFRLCLVQSSILFSICFYWFKFHVHKIIHHTKNNFRNRKIYISVCVHVCVYSCILWCMCVGMCLCVCMCAVCVCVCVCVCMCDGSNGSVWWWGSSVCSGVSVAYVACVNCMNCANVYVHVYVCMSVCVINIEL